MMYGRGKKRKVVGIWFPTTFLFPGVLHKHDFFNSNINWQIEIKRGNRLIQGYIDGF